MASYIIGDIQGCLSPLKCLLEQVDFNESSDTLLSLGDIVNRGPNSLETLRFLKNIKNFKMVLGNHDLHLMARNYGAVSAKKNDTLDEILNAPDREELINWLRRQPLLLCLDKAVLTHAGVPHIWDVEKAQALAREVESELTSDKPEVFLNHMYGNSPDCWSDKLSGLDRLRVVTNYLTRMRVCRQDGTLDLVYKGDSSDTPENCAPWFSYPRNPLDASFTFFFGHWAALPTKSYRYHNLDFHALDSGCVWGNSLTAYRIEDGKRFTCACDV